jgi:hypothetical protein
MIRDGLSAREIERRTGRTAKAVRMRRTVMLGIIKTPRPSDDADAEVVLAFTPADELAILQREHPGESYRNLRIPSEGITARRYSVPLAYSPTGSSAAMCVGTI